MKITFMGWDSGVKVHTRGFRPWRGTVRIDAGGFPNAYWQPGDSGPQVGSPDDPAKWAHGRFVPGKVEDLSLNGNYTVMFHFEEVELKNWIESYIAANPKEALTLLADMLQLAVKKVMKP